jgi:hypothetical protein
MRRKAALWAVSGASPDGQRATHFRRSVLQAFGVEGLPKHTGIDLPEISLPTSRGASYF